MKAKLLIPITLCTSAMFLVACGGDDNFNNDGSIIGKENINWSNSTDLDSVAFPVVNLSYSPDNIVINAGYVADEIHWAITDPENTITKINCESGSAKANNNGSVTLDKCKNFTYTNKSGTLSVLGDDAIISGTINQKHDTKNPLDKSTVSLSKLTIDFKEITMFFDGEITGTYPSPSQNNANLEQLEVTHFEYQIIDKENKNKLSKYTLKDYKLQILESSKPNNPAQIETSIGNLSGESNGKHFSVNFATTEPFRYATRQNFYNHEPYLGKLEIVSTSNQRNNIIIATTNNPSRALYSAFANNIPVSGFPKTVDWNYFD